MVVPCRFVVAFAGVGSLLWAGCSNEPAGDAKPAPAAVKAGANSGDEPSRPLEGLWSGSWGGGGGDGVIFTPVLAAVVVEGDHFAAEGLPGPGRIAGVVRVDEVKKRLTVTHAGEGKAEPQTFGFAYELKGDELTLTDDDKHAVLLTRQKTVRDAAANVQIELVTVSGITPEDDLVTTPVAVIELKDSGRTLYRPSERKVSLKDAAVFAVQADGGKKITLDEARKQVGPGTLVALAWRPYNAPPIPDTPASTLWTASSIASPESDAVQRTLSRTLKPGTLVFVLPAPTFPAP